MAANHQTLETRRSNLCGKFSSKATKNPKHKQLFKVNTKTSRLRQRQPFLCHVVARTQRFENSPLSYWNTEQSKKVKTSQQETVHSTQVNYRTKEEGDLCSALGYVVTAQLNLNSSWSDCIMGWTNTTPPHPWNSMLLLCSWSRTQEADATLFWPN